MIAELFEARQYADLILAAHQPKAEQKSLGVTLRGRTTSGLARQLVAYIKKNGGWAQHADVKRAIEDWIDFGWCGVKNLYIGVYRHEDLRIEIYANIRL